MEGEEAELQSLAVADFELALAEHGPAEAAATLSSYLAELATCPEALLLQLASAFHRHAAPAAAAAAAATTTAGTGPTQPLQPLLDLEQVLLKVVGGSPAAVEELQRGWDGAAAALLYGSGGEPPEAAAARLEAACSAGATSSCASTHLLTASRVASLPPPATHQQACSLAACLLHLRLFQGQLAGAPAGLAAQLEAAAAPPWLGRDLRHTQAQQAAAFEALVGVLQCRSVRQRLDVLAHRQPEGVEEAHAAALRFLLLFRPPLPAAAELWWAHFAAVLHGLVSQARAQAGAGRSGSGAAGGAGAGTLGHPTLCHLIRTLCCHETAHMVVQLTLAHPAFQAPAEGGAGQEAARGGAGGRAAAGGRRRKKADGGEGEADVAGGGGAGGGAKAAARVRKALGVAAALLGHSVPAFLSGCCELLRPEANAALQTRVEVLAAMGRAAYVFLEEQAGAASDRDSDSSDEEEGWQGGSQEGSGRERSALTAAAPPTAAATAAHRLWLPAALDQVLFVARSDPSVRVRREAVKLLATATGVAPPQESQLVRAVAQRCRDRDEGVRREAFSLLTRFPQPSLERCMGLGDWQALLDCGLAGPLPVVGKPAAPTKLAASIQATAGKLLLCHLGLTGRGSSRNNCKGRGDAQESVPESQDVELGGGGDKDAGWGQEGHEEQAVGSDVAEGVEEASAPEWVRTLRALLPPGEDPVRPDARSLQRGGPAPAVVVQHLHAGWLQGLEQVLDEGQLAAVGPGVEGPGSEAGLLEEEAAEDAGAAGAASGSGGAQDEGGLDWDY